MVTPDASALASQFHHPAAGREVEQAVAGLQVGVQPVFLQVLQQRAARAVDDALRDAGRPARVQHVQRLVEWQGLEVESCGSVAVFRERDGLRQRRAGRLATGVADEHDAFD